MEVTLGFLVALFGVNLGMAAIIGFFVQAAACELELGPLPRAVIGMSINAVSCLFIANEFDVLWLFPLLLVIYYIGTYQIGTTVGHRLGLQAPDENDPPDFFFELFNRGQ
jgi:hypothetical protein